MSLELSHAAAETGAVLQHWFLEGTVAPSAGLTRTAIHKERFVIGRGTTADLCLPSNNVSKVHAELIVAGRIVVLQDCGSTNGTFINGARVTSATPVGDGDLLQFADMEFRLGCTDESSGENTAIAARPEEGWLISQLHEFVNHQRFEMHFQPIVTAAGVRMGVEALVRCRVSGLESPLRLFAAAERLGLEERISVMCRSAAVDSLADTARGEQLFLNTHPHEHLGAELIHSLAELRARAPERPLVLEIHEAAVPDMATIREFHAALRDLQIGMAYDDFGAGQSRLRELGVVPPDYLKFDRSLLLELQTATAAHRALVQSLVRMAADQGIATLAEGLDDATTIDVCRQMGFTHFQGYYFGRPVPAAELA